LEYDTNGVLSSNLNELCKYCYETNHGVSIMTYMITETLWQQLSDNQREAISKASKESSDMLNEQYHEELDKAKAELAASGVTFVTPTDEERARMIELLEPVTESIIDGRCTMEELDALRNLPY
jgi:TRAP-type C4-dicarboxylate transport system substrate-binding protein